MAADLGFDTVRLPVRWANKMAFDAPYAVTAVFFERVDWAIDTAFAHGLQVVLTVYWGHFNSVKIEPRIS